MAKNNGVVENVDAARIVVRVTDSKIQIMLLIFTTSQSTRDQIRTRASIRDLVSVGDKVKFGDILADGPSVDNGELALGQNIRIAFMPWNGYNFRIPF